MAGDVVFCWKCGAYSRERGAALKKQCPGGPKSSTVQCRLKRLKDGKHPLSKEVLGQPKPLGGEQAACMLRALTEASLVLAQARQPGASFAVEQQSSMFIV